MRRYLASAVVLGVAMIMSAHADAGTVIGPFVDFRDTVGPDTGAPATIVIKTKFWVIRDTITIDISLRSSLGGVGYVSSPSGDFKDNLRVFTFYGLDVSPTSPELLLTGVDGTSPVFEPVGGETLFGKSGKSYQSDESHFVKIGELPNLFPDLDLSPFARGDRDSFVYVFGTTIPGTDLAAVPEPSTLISAAMASCVMLGVVRRRRSTASALKSVA